MSSETSARGPVHSYEDVRRLLNRAGDQLTLRYIHPSLDRLRRIGECIAVQGFGNLM